MLRVICQYQISICFLIFFDHILNEIISYQGTVCGDIDDIIKAEVLCSQNSSPAPVRRSDRGLHPEDL